MASRGSLGKRNVAIIWMLFGSGLRVNEVAKLTVSDLVRSTGEIKTTFTIPSSYTKTGKSRTAYILAKAHREAIAAWIGQRTTERVFVADSCDHGGLRPDSPMFAITKKGKSWRTMAFRDKKYSDARVMLARRRCVARCRTLSARYSKTPAYIMAPPILAGVH